MTWKQVDIMRGAEKLVRECADVQSNEDVLVITDTSTTDLGLAVASAASPVAKDVSIAIMRLYTRMSHGMNPPRPIAAAMKAADVVFAIVEWSLFHSPARIEANKAGARVLAIATATEDILVSIADTPFLQMEPIVNKVTDLLRKANSAHMTTLAGTDITFDLRGRSKYSEAETGMCRKGDVLMCESPPGIESNICPVEDTTEGIFVVDGCQAAVGFIQDPITFHIEKGTIVKIEGHEEARRLREYLEKLDDPNVYRVAEFAIGLNPNAKMSGHFIEAESVYGSAHIGIGNNLVNWGAKIDAKAHSDNVAWFPTIELDGKTIMKNGKLTIEGIPEIKGRYVK
jgi:leucyl aminopeptidase (aminopeptidase T)